MKSYYWKRSESVKVDFKRGLTEAAYIADAEVAYLVALIYLDEIRHSREFMF